MVSKIGLRLLLRNGCWDGMCLHETRCSSPILFALDSFLVFYHIHPFMDCNTRVSEILINAILMSYDLPPVQLLLFMDKRTLRKLQVHGSVRLLLPSHVPL